MKNKFIKTTFILLIGGFITKILSMVTKIIMSRQISTEVLGLYMMLMPTLSLVISLSQFGIPTAISKLVAEEKRNNQKLVFSILPFVAFINIFLMIGIFIIAPFLSEKLLKSTDLYLGVVCIGFIIPFTSIGSIISSYFLGKNKVIPSTFAHIVESIIKLLLFTLYLPLIANKSYSYIICFLILSNVITEIISIFIMMLFLPKNLNITKKDLIPEFDYVKSALSIGIPNTGARLIGNIGFFLEPIILTFTLKLIGYSSIYINYNYGIITGYVIPLIMTPSFFTMAISQALLPTISKDYALKKKKSVKTKIKLAIFLSLIIGCSATFFFISCPSTLLKFIYNTTEGANYLRILAPIFLIQYIQAPLSASLDAIGKSSANMKAIFIGTIIRCSSLFIFSLFRIGLWGLVISSTLNIITVTIYDYFILDKYVNA